MRFTNGVDPECDIIDMKLTGEPMCWAACPVCSQWKNVSMHGERERRRYYRLLG